MAPPATLTKVVQLSRQILIGRTVQRWIYKFITKYFRTLLTSSKERIPNNHPTVIKHKTLKDIDQNKLENIPSNLNFNHASGHATFLPAGRTLKFIALFLTNEVYNNEIPHIWKGHRFRSWSRSYDEFVLQIQIPPQLSINRRLEAKTFCLNFPPGN